MPHPVDVHVGARLRVFRKEAGMSQQVLGDRLGLTFQQVQKYERGTNRVSASKLFEASDILGVRIESFFEGLQDTPAAQPSQSVADDPYLRKLIRIYHSQSSEEARRRLVEAAEVVARPV